MSHVIMFSRPTEWHGVFLCSRGRGGGCSTAVSHERVEVPYRQVCARLPERYGQEPIAVHHVDDVSAYGLHAWSIDWSDASSCHSEIVYCTEARCVPEGELAVLWKLGEWSLWRRVRQARLPFDVKAR